MVVKSLLVQCELCPEKLPAVNETRDGKKICSECVVELDFCEICGSIRMFGQSRDDQLHFEEECFK